MNPNLTALDFEPAPMCEGRTTCVRPATVYVQRYCCPTISTLCVPCIHVLQRLTFTPAVTIRCPGCDTPVLSSSAIKILGPIGKVMPA